MKKIYQILIIACMLCALAACGGSNSGGNSGNKSSYRDAVKNNDFESVHEILNIYREEYLSFQSKGFYEYSHEGKDAEGKYYQAFDYIYKAEIHIF